MIDNKVHLPVFQQIPLFKDKTELPTGKNHVSFSEVTMHVECSWRHKLVHIDKLGQDPPNQHTEFGQALHDAGERYILSCRLHSYDHQENIEAAVIDMHARFAAIEFNDKVEVWETGLRNILTQLPAWMDQEFPGWQPVAAEFMLFEPIEGQKNKFFKGYMDTVIRAPKPPRKGSKPKPNAPVEWQYWILDWKGTEYGWSLDKKTDPMKRMQLVLYKHYLCTKLGLDLKQVKCGFVLCKRKGGKESKHLELVEVSVGPETIRKALETVEKMINLLAKRMFMKNKNSCRWCKFKATKECPGS